MSPAHSENWCFTAALWHTRRYFHSQLQWHPSVHFLITVLSIIAHNFLKDLRDVWKFSLHPPSLSSCRPALYHQFPAAHLHPKISVWSAVAITVARFSCIAPKAKKRNTWRALLCKSWKRVAMREWNRSNMSAVLQGRDENLSVETKLRDLNMCTAACKWE